MRGYSSSGFGVYRLGKKHSLPIRTELTLICDLARSRFIPASRSLSLRYQRKLVVISTAKSAGSSSPRKSNRQPLRRVGPTRARQILFHTRSCVIGAVREAPFAVSVDVTDPA